MKKQLITFLFAIMILSCVCSGCKSYDNALEHIIGTKIINIGLRGGDEPMCFTKSGELIGLTVDIGNELAARLGATAQFFELGEDEALEALTSGKIDCYLNFLPGGRKELANFAWSDGRLKRRQVVVVMAGSPYNRLVDLKGYTVTTVPGTDAADALQAAEEFRAGIGALSNADNFDAALRQLIGGKAHGFAADEYYFMSKTKSFAASYHIIDTPLRESSYVTVFAPRENELKDRFDLLYSSMANDGTWEKILEKWLGSQWPKAE